MTIDYKELRALVDVRLKQIEDASLEYEKYNQERTELLNIKASINRVIMNERAMPDHKMIQDNPIKDPEEAL